jgi:salicylate hydroxylase
MLPFSGQGACQAIEGAGLVGLMFQDADVASVPKKLKQFENMRSKRIALIQMLSRIRFGRESEAAYALIKHDQVNPKGSSNTFQQDTSQYDS